MTGNRTLDTLFTAEQMGGNMPPKESKKMGRNQDLVQQRDERMCARVYYLRVFKKLRNEDLMEQLQQEFDLTFIQLQRIMTGDEFTRDLRKLLNDAPKPRYFKKLWPWIVW